MTLDDIRRRVANIASAAGDDERAHSLEDDLMCDFIDHVAKFGPPDLAEMAAAVAATAKLDFARWCA